MKIKSACVVLFAILMQFTFANGGLGYSLLPTIKSIENESSCLLYAVNNEVHRMCFPSMKSERVCFIPDKIRPKMMSEIRAGAGNLLWHAGNKLYTYDKKEIHTIELKKFQTSSGFSINHERVIPHFSDVYVDDILISPDGTQIVWNVNRIIDITFANGGTASIIHEVYSAGVDGRDKRSVIKEQFSVKNVFADCGLKRHLIHWPITSKDQFLLSTLHIGQLYSSFRGLFALSIESGVLSVIDENLEIFLDISLDGTKIAYTPNDETCCAGSNYTNNTVHIVNLTSSQYIKVYDEWGEFKNKPASPDEEGGEEYYPRNAYLSPNGKWLAISISGNKKFVTIRKTDSGEEIKVLDGKQAIGWINENNVLLGKGCKYELDRDPHFTGLSIFNVTNDKEKTIPLNNIVPITPEVKISVK